MAGTRAALRYAKALLDLSEDQKKTDRIYEDMQGIADTLNNNAELEAVLQSPVVRSAVKTSVLLEVFKQSDDLTKQLFNTLITNKRIALLGAVAESYGRLYDDLKGHQIAMVTTAVPLTDSLKAKVLKRVKSLTDKEVDIENIIDESILGGYIVRLGDKQINASVAGQLSRLKREFKLN